MTTRSVEPSTRKLWLAALKPPMYSVAIMPILSGSAVAYADTGFIDRWILVTFLLAAVFILAWENLSNDVFDAETGIDINKHHSLVALTRNKRLIFALSNLFLVLGIAGILAIALQQRDPTVFILILVCCGLGYAYQGPPFRLGYRGLGEILCFFSFGPLGVGAAYYSQTQSWSLSSQLIGVIIGITTSLVLFCSHFHQVEDDIAAGKRSPIVRLGTDGGARLIPWLCGITFAVLGFGIFVGMFPVWTGLMFLGIPSARRLINHVNSFHHQPQKVSNAKFYAIGFHFWSGVLLTLGFWLGTWLS
jgi:1,4-dihydroxy-2-naphthoate octaprenyltransferase